MAELSINIEPIRVLLVDDEQSILDLLLDIFSDYDEVAVWAFADSAKAMAHLDSQAVDIVFTDLKMPGVTGIDILKKTRGLYPEALVVLVTGFGSLETTLEAIENGAYDYLTKPFQMQEFEFLLRRTMSRVGLFRELAGLRAELDLLRGERGGLQDELERLKAELSKLGYRRAQEDRVLGPLRQLSQYGNLEKVRIRKELAMLDQLHASGGMSDEEHESRKQKLLQGYSSVSR